MLNMSKEVRREVIRMMITLAPMCLVMYGLFAIAGYWQLDTVIGTLAGYSLAFLYYFMLACSVETSMTKETADEAKLHQFRSYYVRLGVIAIVIVAAIKAPQVNAWATIVPLVFPRFAIYILNAWDAKNAPQSTNDDEGQESVDER